MNITFDLETLGNTSNAPIVQIGAVKFTNDGEICDRYSASVKLESLSKYDFKVDFETVKWWMSQEDVAIKRVFCGEGVNLRLALKDFLDWIGKHGDYVYWSHATFDPPILINNLKAVGLPNPIPYKAYRDIRTLTHFVGKIEVERKGVHHNALDDCEFQAEYISKGLRMIKKTIILQPLRTNL